MQATIKPIDRISGVFTVPGDKSITHRAIMFNAVSEGMATITGALLGEDCLATIDCMRKLGALITIDGSSVTVLGAKKLKNNQKLYVGNSGTTIRLLTGLLAGRKITATLDGDDSIKKRPMLRIIEPLTKMGAKIISADGKAPLTVKPATLNGIDYTLPVASAQVKSCLLLAGLSAKTPTTVRQPQLTRDHSELMLSSQSADIETSGKIVTIKKSNLKSISVRVPGDISSAAYLIVLATALPNSDVVIKNVGINPTRRAIISLISACGGKISMLNTRMVGYEQVADVLVQSAKLCPFCIQGDMIANLIDEIPVLAVLAAMIDGESRIKDAQELKAKESDRIKSTVAALQALNVKAAATDDGMVIKGSGVIMGGGTIDPEGDHRIAMSMAVAGALSLDGCIINGAECVNVSYPDFFSTVLPKAVVV